ncbi:MAG: hypothetical protein COS84_05585 [Armatimonadetes bacterium CG07_land_8_20_14_0_80_40_9]|nr:MAG: hypothetical protein COS84_05585 [Armatimonadetes bacterium CG07_land_8_20_14_0_80_40_9]
MAKGKIDAEEYEIIKPEKLPIEVLKGRLERLVGKEILISSNWERFKADSKRKVTVYSVGQEYNELGQVLTLENPSLPERKIPILISPNLQVSEEGKKIILRYPRELRFRALQRKTLPDLEIYIEEV